jgi:hypothetical protein
MSLEPPEDKPAWKRWSWWQWLLGLTVPLLLGAFGAYLYKVNVTVPLSEERLVDAKARYDTKWSDMDFRVNSQDKRFDQQEKSVARQEKALDDMLQQLKTHMEQHQKTEQKLRAAMFRVLRKMKTTDKELQEILLSQSSKPPSALVDAHETNPVRPPVMGSADLPLENDPAVPAKDRAKQFTPIAGQEGKDVIWVPTPQLVVERMLTLAKVKASDYVVDLGSGDGRTVITAAKKFGATALGIEYNSDMVELSKRAAEKEGVSGKAQFVKADIFDADFSRATVITMYLLPSLNVKLRPKILEMKAGTRVVSNSGTKGDWKPDEVDSVAGVPSYLWVVPAKVGGTWKFNAPGQKSGELLFSQRYQSIRGRITLNGRSAELSNPEVHGDTLSFSINGDNYTGQVNGDRIEGTTSGGEKFTASRS